jgi:hypothetical protein
MRRRRTKTVGEVVGTAAFQPSSMPSKEELNEEFDSCFVSYYKHCVTILWKKHFPGLGVTVSKRGHVHRPI